MRISGPGISKFARGYTLIEMLLVLLVIGISLRMVIPSLSKTDHDILTEEANRMIQLMNYANNEAVATGQTLAWDETPRGYHFLMLDTRAEVWRPITGNAILRARTFPPGVEVGSFETQTSTTNRVIFSPSSVHAPFVIALKNQAEQILLQGNLLGQVSLSAPRQ